MRRFLIILKKFFVLVLATVMVITMTLLKTEKQGLNFQEYEYIRNNDIQVIKERMIADLYDAEADPGEYMENLQDDGSFSDIDYYTDKKDTWYPVEHLKRILVMQKALYTPDNRYYNNELLSQMVEKSIAFWVEKDFHCDWNDWWNNLGIGPDIADILLFSSEIINKEYANKLTEKLYSITCFTEVKERTVKERKINSTGGNLTDTVNHSLKYAVLTNNGRMIMCLTNLIENELRAFPQTKLFEKRWDAEGIKADMSFQQHFEMLYFGGYGEVFLNGMNKYIRYTDNTQFALNDEHLNFYQDFILDGIQYALVGNISDINASGRSVVREKENSDDASFKKSIIEACDVLINCSAKLDRIDELESLINTRNNEFDHGAGGCKYFYCSDYLVYNNENYVASVRAASKRTKNSEALNGENVWGHYLGAGATMFYTDGNDYFNIFPLWNWNKIPGTTAAQGYLPYGNDSTYTRMGKTSFVGGVSNDKIGMSCIDYNDNKVKGKKSRFMFDEGVVCLGTDISSNTNYEISTCINQTLAGDEFKIKQNGQIKSYDDFDSIGVFDWILNDSIGYVTNSKSNVKLEQRNGNWQTISERVDSKEISGKVFEMSISHGEKPKNGSYDYTVLPNASEESLNKYSKNPTLKTLSNNCETQAVYNEITNDLMAVFWKSGTITMPNGKILTVNDKCVVICEANENGYDVYVSNPKQNKKTIKIELEGKTQKVTFSKGIEAGKAIHLTF